ncbi:MAG TPA: hypothetical protein VN600_12775 [Gemmatimonadaceae bacterium]|nr:hypothetical protein [Gemmatimonadaceae bacterium]
MTPTGQSPPEPTDRQFLRHTLATLAYRAGKTMRDAPPEFAAFCAGPTTRTPGEILVHLGDLMAWGHRMARGDKTWVDSTPGEWRRDVERFFAEVAAFDAYLAGADPLVIPAEKLFQGPIADALWHAGQLAMLRRLAGHQIRGENYAMAQIERGRVGFDQAAPRREFD